MPPEPLSFDRKDFLKERKPSSSDSLGIVPPRTTHNNHGSSPSCRWGAGGGLSDYRRPFSGLHGKRVGGGWHNTGAESGSKENNCMTNSVSMAFGSQKDPKGVDSLETTASPNGNSLPYNDFVNSLDQIQSVDQHAKNSGGGFSTTNNQRLEKETSLGSSLDWKPLKRICSGSLSSRGSGFGHSSGCKIIGVDPFNAKLGAQLGTNTPLRSPSEDAAPCLTPRTSDEASSHKKPRLGWGEGLAKYEKKKVDPDDIVDKETGARNGMVDGVSGSEPLLTSPFNLSDKSPSVNGYSECASPTTSYSFACSSSSGLEEKEPTKTVTEDNETCNPSVASCHRSENHTEGLPMNLELNLISSVNELLQTDDSSSPGSGFVKSTAMDKLQLWKAELTGTLEITETEIDSLENELKSLVSGGGSCPFPRASSSFPTEFNKKTSDGISGPLSERNTLSLDMPVEKSGSFSEELIRVEGSDDKIPGTTFESVEPCSENLGSDDMLGFVTSCGDGIVVSTGSSSTDSDGGDVRYAREDKLYDLILSTNKAIADSASDELSRMLLPTTHLCTNISKATDESLIKKRISSRKRFLKFKERVITSKFRALQYSWKEDLHLLTIKKNGAKSHKKFESSSRMGYADHQKYCSPVYSRLCSGGRMSLVPNTETLDYVNRLLLDSRVRVHRKALKMPCLILDTRERIMTKFISDNGLVENPVEVEKERSVVNPWTEEEKEIFLDKYSLFGKDFKKIAAFLERRTIGDCVEFYYKNHKSDCFQNTKKNSVFANGKSISNTNTYLVTSGRRLNHEAGATSLEMLGAASAMVANVDGQQKVHLEGSNDFAMFCNEQETAAADVLAGICGSISSEAFGSCITSSVEHGDIHHHGSKCQKLGGSSKRKHLTPEGSSLNDDEETCSDDSCGEEVDTSTWSDAEKLRFIKAFRSYGKDFLNISRSMRTKTADQCRVFFSKARKCLGLDVIDVEPGSEGTTGGNQEDGASDPEDACMVDSGSDISQNKSSLECSKMDVEENLVENKPKAELVGVRSNLGGAADSEATQNTCSEGSAGEMNGDSSATGPKVEADTVPCVPDKNFGEGLNDNGSSVGELLTTCPVADLNNASLSSLVSSFDHGHGFKLNGSEKVVYHGPSNDFLMSNFPPRDSTVARDRKTLSQDDVSSRLSFRKSFDKMYQRSSSRDGFHLNLPKLSLLDCAESSQVLKGYPVMSSANNEMNRCLSYSGPSQSKLRLDESLLMDPCLPRQSLSLDVEKRTRSGGDVKLFGQILTKRPQESVGGGKSFDLKFDDRKRASLDVDQSHNNLTIRSHGYWDGNRIRMGVPSMPDSARLLAKYPAAFSKTSAFLKFDQNHQMQSSSLKMVSGFPSCSNNGGASGVEPSRVDKLLLPTRKVNVVGGISDPVAAIRMHYANSELYKNGGRRVEGWRSKLVFSLLSPFVLYVFFFSCKELSSDRTGRLPAVVF